MMDQVLQLTFGLSPEPSSFVDSGVFDVPRWRAHRVIQAAVMRRDIETCRFCRFRSAKYQTLVWIGGPERDVDNLVTSCVFCQQVRCVDVVPDQKSGVLLWLPEVSQVDLNCATFALFALRISQGRGAARARQLLERLMTRRNAAKQHFGSDNPEVLVARLKEQPIHGQRGEPHPNDAVTQGLRLFGLDKRIIREGGLEFNQFPQMLAYWRTANGPLGDESRVAFRAFDELESALATL